jgi:hypothetical protein
MKIELQIGLIVRIMKIVIHGTNGGYHIFTNEKEKLFDARPDSNKVGSIGQQAYSINYNESNIVFSKYKIIRDVVGDKRTGNVAFSLVIPHTKKLSGEDVILVLDKLSSDFYKKHIENDNLDNFREDWALISSIKNDYENKLKPNDEELNSGIADPAFLYYDTILTLQKYFDFPYQEEYSAYKQIFFVEKNFEGKSENPLNALRHDPSANLTGKVDLENPQYKLIYNQLARGGVKIEVKVNGSLRYNKSKVKRKEDLEISYAKQYYDTKNVKKGKWYEIGEEFLIINDDEKTITVRDDIKLEPITYTFAIQTKDRFSNPINAEIILKVSNFSPERKTINNSIQITAEELQNKCYVIAKKENLISPQREIKLEDIKVGIILVLSEHKKVNFYVKDENGLVNNYNIQISNKEVQPKEGDVVFIGDEIEKIWQISVSNRDYETERFNYCPAKDENPKYVVLKRKPTSPGPYLNKKKYYIRIDETKGKRSCNGSHINEYEHKLPDFTCDTKYGYKFDRWESYENKPFDNYDGYYEAIFKELWYRKVPKIAWIFFIIAIVTSTVFLIPKADDPITIKNIVNAEISNTVNSYVDGIELNMNRLKTYKSMYCDINTPIKSVANEKSLWQKIWVFGSNDESNSQAKTSLIPEFCSKIDNAISIRNAINLGEIYELEAKVYSESQQNFKNAIDSIDDKYKKQVGDKLNASKVSIMNLDQIADLLLKTQKDLREKEVAIQNEKEDVKKTNQDKKKEQKSNDQKTNNNLNQQNSQTQKQKTSSDSLEKEFWDLVHSGNAKMVSYSAIIKKHKNKGGDIIIYLNKICQNSSSFKKFKDIPEVDRKLAKTLSEIDIN